MAYVEVKAKTVEMAIEAAMRELGVDSRDRLDIQVIQEPERGFLGFGGQDAVVKVAEKAGRAKRGRSRGRSRSRGKGKGDDTGGASPSGVPEGDRNEQTRSRGGRSGNGRSEGQGESQSDAGKSPARNRAPNPKADDRPDLDPAAQRSVVVDFLRGLLDAFGLEGAVEAKLEDDVIVVDVTGEQTEALVGPRGSVMEAVHELTKTVLQRAAQAPARVRIDVAGYAERRRQALTIYAGELIDQVVAEGGELMLEPMSASDRKVIHDAVAAREGVRSYSEGEAPRRYVVIASEAPGEKAAPQPDSPTPDREEMAPGD